MRVDVGRPMLAGPLARMQQHVLDDGVGALAMLHDFLEIALQHPRQFGDFGPQLVVDSARFSTSLQFVDQLGRKAEKLLTKFSGFLISCAMPAVSWPSEASFSVCTSRSCAVRRSSSERDNSWFDSAQSEQPGVLDRDHRLVGKCLRPARSACRE